MLDNFKIKTECAVCSTKIWAYDGFKLKKTDEYNEATVKLNNLSNMAVGVCGRHSKLKKSDLPIITEKNHQGWLEEVALGIGKKEWVNEVGSKLRAVGIGG